MQPPSPIVWHFPLSRPHTGVPLGNGVQGVLVWGESSLLLTVARAGFWDRRNGHSINPGTMFSSVRSALESQDDKALQSLFPDRPAGSAFPQQMGGGRMEIVFPDGLRPIKAELHPGDGRVTVTIARDDDGDSAELVVIRQSSCAEICWLEGHVLDGAKVRLWPAYHLARGNEMGELGIGQPEEWSDEGGGGFLQSLPADDPLAVGWSRTGRDRVILATALGIDAGRALRVRLREFDINSTLQANHEFWTTYWTNAARVRLPDEALQRLYDVGLYKQAGLIRESAPAATLQGPWMEDTRIPPWSNDYHFNINVQLVYGAAFPTGQALEMKPLWDMLRAWLPRLRALGESFYESPGAMLLPHAVDDRCQMMGCFWAGAIDQACISWMGQMAWRAYLHTGDHALLDELAYPLLEGAFLGYWAMLEKIEEPGGGYRYSLPISVSPEFGGSDAHRCQGRDASFQLAALRMTAELLIAAATALSREVDPRWSDVLSNLPHYTTVDASDASYGWIGEPRLRIALWEGQDLSESHRHHSHLAAIYPFCTIDPFNPAHHNVVVRSLNRWNMMGAGNWTGWCLPWASILCSRCGLADAALSWLHLLEEHFTNEGHATLHNANAAGVFAWDDGSLAWPEHRKGADYLYHEIMQMDAAMGAICAILELLIFTRAGVVYIADHPPKGWRDASFSRVRVEGGFELDATSRHGRAEVVTIRASRDSRITLSHSLGDKWSLDGKNQTGKLASLDLRAGQSCLLKR